MNARRAPYIVTRVCLVAVVVLLSAGCDQLGGTDEPQTHRVEVHLQTGFGGALVRVQLNDQIVFEDTLPGEEPFSGPVHTVMVEEQAGRHRLQIHVDGLRQKETAFTLDDTLYIGVQNTPTEILFVIQKTPFLYL